jgi:predicted Zn finger-like uncharacterized protein
MTSLIRLKCDYCKYSFRKYMRVGLEAKYVKCPKCKNKYVLKRL